MRTLFVGLLGLLVILAACTEKSTDGVVCNPPYMRYAAECCLDQNTNNICDKDEGGQVNAAPSAQGVAQVKSLPDPSKRGECLMRDIDTNTWKNKLGLFCKEKADCATEASRQFGVQEADLGEYKCEPATYKALRGYNTTEPMTCKVVEDCWPKLVPLLYGPEAKNEYEVKTLIQENYAPGNEQYFMTKLYIDNPKTMILCNKGYCMATEGFIATNVKQQCSTTEFEDTYDANGYKMGSRPVCGPSCRLDGVCT